MRRSLISSPVPIPEKPNAEWIIWWDTRKRTEGWSKAVALTEAGALERAQHFIKLGFFVYAIRDPSGALCMGEEDIARKFADVLPITQKEPRPQPAAPYVPASAAEDL